MQITFDPRDPDECDETLCIIARLQPDVVKLWLIYYNRNQDADTPPAQTAQPETATAEPDTAPAQPDTAPTQPETVAAQPDTDCHGMTHDDAIHSTPASKNADGSWRAKRGQKEVTDMRITIACPDAPRIERAWRGCSGLTSFPFDRHIIRD